MIKWTEQNVIDAVEKAMSPPKNGRMPSGLNTQALQRLMEQAKSGAPFIPPPGVKR